MKQGIGVFKTVHEELQGIAHILRDLPWWRWVITALVIVIAIMLVQTAGEFLVALENRYASYPVGTDSNMYGRSGALTAILSLCAAWAAAFILKIVFVRWYIPISFLLICILGTVFYLPIWVETIMGIVYISTLFASFLTRSFRKN